jgi:hypothetical protein
MADLKRMRKFLEGIDRGSEITECSAPSTCELQNASNDILSIPTPTSRRIIKVS